MQALARVDRNSWRRGMSTLSRGWLLVGAGAGTNVDAPVPVSPRLHRPPRLF